MTGAPDPDPRGRPEPSAGSTAGVTSVGRIAGLRPRRRPGDGGEVDGADVDLVDALDPVSRGTVADWLRESSSLSARRFRLRTFASFLRWLRLDRPDLAPLRATGAHVREYCDATLAGLLPDAPGRPLAKATVSRRRAALTSLYHFAWENGPGPVGHDGAAEAEVGPAGNRAALTRDERRALRRGIARLADEGHVAEAAAVALLDATGAPAEAVAGASAQDFRTVADGHGGEHVVMVVHTGCRVAAFVLPPLARRLLRELGGGRRSAPEPVFGRYGEPAGAAWVGAALTRAALAGGIAERRAALLRPEMLRPGP
ncbi:hypothetical protein GCM10010149_21890 [Nonomuraea roseoviolacea subsp. roseoviolacea]|uniref:Core-binding (CB) domain-containing protein n=1 Tax=Nonomuraea roseoviolacea subsp. carminata TaxID=160689 RepID=A0ABT1KCY6_9ACTN|nr:hypothetical protein [Nonomuraea roseoviolacea]MCP2351820.1 hypothetical protein [Nonomuraea roseoviolacea subsp. carminata]